MSELIAAWLDHHEGKVSSKNFNHYEQVATAFLDSGLYDMNTSEFTPRRLKELREFLIEQGLARSTINQRIGRVKKLFKWGVSEEMVSPSIMSALYAVDGLRKGETTAADPKSRPPVSFERVDEVRQYLPPVVTGMLELQWLTGMRSANICDMTLSQIDQSDDVWIYRPSSHKGLWRGKGLAIPIGPNCQKIIKAAISGRSQESPIFRPVDAVKWHSENNKQFISWVNREAGEWYTPNTYRQSVMRAQARAAGLSITRKLPTKEEFLSAGWIPWTPYQLRHAAITKLRQQYSLEDVRAYIGHSTVQATEIYSDHDIATAKRIALDNG